MRINEDDQITQSCFYRNKNVWSTNITQKKTVYADQLSGKIDRRKIGQDTKHFYKKKATLPAPGTSILHLPVTLHILTYLYGPC